MRQEKEVTINGTKYQIEQFGAMQGFSVGKRVGKVMLPVISTAFGDEEASMSDLMSIVADNLDKIDDETIFELLSKTYKNNKEIKFDDEFAGNYMTLFKLLWEVIQFNFSDLLFMEPPEEETNE